MKIIILLANSTEVLMKKCIEHMQKVLEELDTQIEIVELNRLPYFENMCIVEAQQLADQISDAKGLIACSNVHIGGMHGAMQTFFDHMTLYTDKIKAKPMFVMTYSSWMGEVKGANDILYNWQTLGGVDGGKICLNKHIEFERVMVSVERSIESFYRMMKQDRSEIIPSEYILFKEQLSPRQEVETTQINISTEEQNIQELTAILKGKFQPDEGEEFVRYNTGTYQRPQISGGTANNTSKKIQNLPHYFIAQHDKELDFSVQINIIDKTERGGLIISQGDCRYVDGEISAPTLEISAADRVIDSILSKEMTYQKAFMLGKIKVRGNFIFLSKMDQIFKGM